MFTEIMENGTVLEHRVYCNEESMSYRDDGALASPASCETMIQPGEVAALYFNSSPCSLDQCRPEPRITMSGLTALVFTGAFVVARANTTPGSQVMGVRETRDSVWAYLENDLFGTTLLLSFHWYQRIVDHGR